MYPKLLVVIVVIAAFAVVAVPASPVANRRRSTSGYYNVLSINWPPTVCVNQTHTCIKPLPQRWTVHGLWPNGLKNEMISYCTQEKFDATQVKSLKPEMDEKWLSVKLNGNEAFWKHEWEKHGTCATGNSQFQYFNHTLKLFDRYDINRLLSNAGIKFGGLVSTVDVRKAIVQGAKIMDEAVIIQCKNSYKKPYLFEIRICFTSELKPTKCLFKSNCSVSQVYYLGA